MSVSATMAESWTVSRFAILRITVPPPNVGLEITVRSTASSSSIEPVIGARTWVSSIASLAVWRPASALTTAALAVAWARLEDSYSVSEIDCDRYKASLRLSCAVAVSSCARALSSAACAWARFCWGMRGSIRANSWPFHLVARLDGHLDDLAPCLGLDDERENRLHHARRARGDD